MHQVKRCGYPTVSEEDLQAWKQSRTAASCPAQQSNWTTGLLHIINTALQNIKLAQQLTEQDRQALVLAGLRQQHTECSTSS